MPSPPSYKGELPNVIPKNVDYTKCISSSQFANSVHDLLLVQLWALVLELPTPQHYCNRVYGNYVIYTQFFNNEKYTYDDIMLSLSCGESKKDGRERPMLLTAFFCQQFPYN